MRLLLTEAFNAARTGIAGIQQSLGYASWAEFEGGSLCLEDGRIFNEKRKWFSFDGAKISHWNEPITSGRKYSIVAYPQRGAFKSEGN